MPKIKKSKTISLVSAYESGAESQSEVEDDDDNDEQIEQDIDSETDKSESRDEETIEKDLDEENYDKIADEDSEEYLARKRKQIGQSDEEFESQERIDSSDENQCKKIKDENDVSNQNPDNQNEPIQNEDSNSGLPRSTFTLENGFPPGCESIRLPPAPKALCSKALQNKIIQVTDRMRLFNYSINADIHNKKTFKNPSIYEKLIEVYGIDEFGSSFPSHIEDLKSHGFMLYDELDLAQRNEWAKKEKEKKERTKIEMISGTKQIKK